MLCGIMDAFRNHMIHNNHIATPTTRAPPRWKPFNKKDVMRHEYAFLCLLRKKKN